MEVQNNSLEMANVCYFKAELGYGQSVGLAEPADKLKPSKGEHGSFQISGKHWTGIASNMGQKMPLTWDRNCLLTLDRNCL